MWLWILLSTFTIGHFILATPEILGNEYAPEDGSPDDSMFLYMDERAYSPQRDNRDIEARRRSALDKNFMRFGRSDNFYPKSYETDFEEPENEEFPRSVRTHNKNDNFIRFGRASNSDFMRFGRDSYATRITRGLKDKNFIRFGRSVSLKRSRRDVDAADFDQYKRANNRDMLRFGRANNRDMLRFGRNNNRDMLRFGRRDNFLRFGRNPYTTKENPDGQIASNLTNENRERLTPSSYSTLLDLLTELALQMRHEDKSAASRVG